MTDQKRTTTGPKPRQEATRESQTEPADAPHTEVLSPGRKPQPRAKVLPPELGEDDDDMFNDMPV